MATIKSYTDLSQSKKLAEILPLDSADMDYIPVVNTDNIDGEYSIIVNKWDNDHIIEEGWIPCWSLTALLSVLPDYTLQTNSDGTVFVVCDSKKPMISDAYDNPIDACVEMIERLHDLKMLRFMDEYGRGCYDALKWVYEHTYGDNYKLSVKAKMQEFNK